MKVLRINTSDIVGGAAIAISRLHQGLISKGIDSKFLVQLSQTTSSAVKLLPRAKWVDLQVGRLTRNLGFNEIHLTSTFDTVKHPFYQEADILHLHNLHGGYFNYLALPALTQEKPAILTLHDMWAFTGHCAYSFECDRWQIGCGHCPDLKTYPAVKRDQTKWEWKLKQWAYQHSNLKAVVTTSQWMMERAQQSMLGHLPIYRIPPGLDTSCYQPLNKSQCRELLGLPLHQPVVMAAADRLSDPRKGGALMVQALNTLPPSLQSELVLITMGYGAEKLAESVAVKVFNLGFLSGDRLKAIAYSAADLFLFPTCAENFGLVAQESIACGTPVVAFAAGGVPDIVRPKITGLLAEVENVTQFRDAIVQLLEDRATRERMGQAGRAIAQAEYSLDLYAQRYIDLYQQALQPA